MATGRTGWLEKKGGFRTNWLKRWFEIQGSLLCYYDKEKEGIFRSKKGEIRLDIVSDVRHSQAAVENIRPHEIELVTSERTYRCDAADDTDRDAWVAALQEAAAGLGRGGVPVKGPTAPLRPVQPILNTRGMLSCILGVLP